jgi:hypothetical protein
MSAREPRIGQADPGLAPAGPRRRARALAARPGIARSRTASSVPPRSSSSPPTESPPRTSSLERPRSWNEAEARSSSREPASVSFCASASSVRSNAITPANRASAAGPARRSSASSSRSAPVRSAELIGAQVGQVVEQRKLGAFAAHRAGEP